MQAKLACSALLLLGVACIEDVSTEDAASQIFSQSAGDVALRSKDPHVLAPRNLLFPGEAYAGQVSQNNSPLRRRRGSRHRRRATRRRSKKSGARRRRRRRRRRRSNNGGNRRRGAPRTPITTTAPPSGSPPTPAPDACKRQTSINKKCQGQHPETVNVPDSMEFVGYGGCADANNKFYNGVIPAGVNPPSYAAYKPQPAEVDMTLQRCLDILHILGTNQRNGKTGTQGVCGIRFGACHDAMGIGCACYVIGENPDGARQVQIPRQPSWPQQCCNPPGYGCWPCKFTITGPQQGGRGPIDNEGGGFHGVCYRLKNSFG